MLMEFLSRPVSTTIGSDLANFIAPLAESPSGTYHSHQNHHFSSDDSITSLMHMADKMEALLPSDPSIDFLTTMDPQKPLQTPPSNSNYMINDSTSLLTGSSNATTTTSSSIVSNTKAEDSLHPSDPSMFHQQHQYVHQQPPQHQYTNSFPTSSSTNLSKTSTVTPSADSLILFSEQTFVDDNNRIREATTTTNNFSTSSSFKHSSSSSSCDGKLLIQKTTRKPKTYSKPVASRFCHICSRMPRRGQGSAVCKRMREGYCRKIVCEQCINEQGWNFQNIQKNMNDWLCPHCAGVCPARSQCHIYNRINARRKRVGQHNQAINNNYSQTLPNTSYRSMDHVELKESPTSSPSSIIQNEHQHDMIYSQNQTLREHLRAKEEFAEHQSLDYDRSQSINNCIGNIFNSKLTNAVSSQILEPSPNFRLNLPQKFV